MHCRTAVDAKKYCTLARRKERTARLLQQRAQPSIDTLYVAGQARALRHALTAAALSLIERRPWVGIFRHQLTLTCPQHQSQ